LLPKKIEKLKKGSYVSAGSNHSCLVGKHGEVIVWGCATAGRLGISKMELKQLSLKKKVKTEFNNIILNSPYESIFNF